MNSHFLLDAGGGGMANFAMIGLMIVVFYFFMILPQTRKQKQQRKFREEIKEGDKIVTIGGIHAKIIKTHDDNTITIESEGTRLKVDRAAVSVEGTQALNKAS